MLPGLVAAQRVASWEQSRVLIKEYVKTSDLGFKLIGGRITSIPSCYDCRGPAHSRCGPHSLPSAPLMMRRFGEEGRRGSSLRELDPHLSLN